LVVSKLSEQEEQLKVWPMHRDTAVDWKTIGATEPWYGVLSTEKFLKSNLTPSSIEDF
jgi:hypothetical protein